MSPKRYILPVVFLAGYTGQCDLFYSLFAILIMRLPVEFTFLFVIYAGILGLVLSLPFFLPPEKRKPRRLIIFDALILLSGHTVLLFVLLYPDTLFTRWTLDRLELYTFSLFAFFFALGIPALIGTLLTREESLKSMPDAKLKKLLWLLLIPAVTLALFVIAYAVAALTAK